MKELMNIKIDEVIKNDAPKFVKTKLIKASREDGKIINWEMIEAHSSVHVLVDNIETNNIMIVEQVRVPALVNGKGDGICSEMCAGIIDKDYSIEQIAVEEVIEEMGYKVELEDIIPVRKYLSSVGTQATDVNTFRVTVTEDMKVNEGGGLPSEDIRIRNIPYSDVADFIFGIGKYKEVNTDATTLYLMSIWMLTHNTEK
jgi:UDP-sugar diphosphatase